jgi:hypothetical protein
MEFDLNSYTPTYKHLSPGGAVWDIQLNDEKDRFLIGSEDGCLRVYSMEDKIYMLKVTRNY